MRVLIQRVNFASVKVEGQIVGEIKKGYLLFVGFTNGDDLADVNKLSKKIVNLRIFPDDEDKINKSLKDVDGSILSISQFTLYAKLDGRRPSFSNALSFSEAKALYESFNEELSKSGFKVEKGIFGADMKVSLENDGPFTIWMDSKEEQ